MNLLGEMVLIGEVSQNKNSRVANGSALRVGPGTADSPMRVVAGRAVLYVLGSGWEVCELPFPGVLFVGPMRILHQAGVVAQCEERPAGKNP